ncbi:MAG: hypothetical protein JW884_01960 [Deltaproteobacteria bacterium]|nr:hypothetical protein [Deltaproteobacteria bacterium]
MRKSAAAPPGPRVGGGIVYHRYNEPLSMLGFAAARDVFGDSLYEPCGQIDRIGNLYGATATNRDAGGLWCGLHRSVEFHRCLSEVWEKQLKRIVWETRQKDRPDRVVAQYIAAYERLNGGIPLA